METGINHRVNYFWVLQENLSDNQVNLSCPRRTDGSKHFVLAGSSSHNCRTTQTKQVQMKYRNKQSCRHKLEKISVLEQWNLRNYWYKRKILPKVISALIRRTNCEKHKIRAYFALQQCHHYRICAILLLFWLCLRDMEVETLESKTRWASAFLLRIWSLHRKTWALQAPGLSFDNGSILKEVLEISVTEVPDPPPIPVSQKHDRLAVFGLCAVLSNNFFFCLSYLEAFSFCWLQ